MSEGVLVDDEGFIRTIRLSNPEKRNALTREMMRSLTAALPGSEDGIRAVILRGDPAGKAFSAGYDIAAIDESERAKGLDPIREPADALESCPVPTIACLEGAAFGGGIEIALSCTLRVAQVGAKLGMPPARLGLVYSTTGMQRFLRALPPAQVQRLFLTAERIDAEEAARIGLVELVSDDALAQAREWATSMASNAPLAVRGTLDAIRRLSRPAAPEAEDLSAIGAARALTIGSADLREAVAAFGEKRPPVFRGE